MLDLDLHLDLKTEYLDLDLDMALLDLLQVWKIAVLFGVKKTEWWGYQKVKKLDDMFSCFDTITNVADERTDRRTPHDIGRVMHSIKRQKCHKNFIHILWSLPVDIIIIINIIVVIIIIIIIITSLLHDQQTNLQINRGKIYPNTNNRQQ